MPILKSITAPTGAAVGFHKAKHVSLDVDAQQVSINVASWVSEEGYLAGAPLVWMWAILATPAALADVDAALLQIPPFDGGTVVTDEALTLDTVKLRQWAAVKDARDAAIAAGFTWDGSKFDSDDRSQQRIGDAVTLAMLAAQAGAAFDIEWTLFDNSTRALSGADIIAVGQALGAFVATAFATGVALRDQINAATTAEEVQAVAWPAPTSG